MMDISRISRLWNEHSTVQLVSKKIHQRFYLNFKHNAQMRDRKTLLSSVVAIVLLILLFYSFAHTAGGYGYRRYAQRRQMRAKFPEDDEQPIIFSKMDYLNQTRKPSENVICFLVASFSGDARVAYDPYPRLRQKIGYLDTRFDDNCTTDVIIFHTGYPHREELIPMMDITRRQVLFVNVDHVFYRFSPGFDPHMTDPSWTQKGKWHYQHMCYFWFKQVFELKIMQQYRYMMRMDDDSQILGKWPNVFDIMTKHQSVYLANKKDADNEYILPGLTLVRNLTVAYIAKHYINVQNPLMLADVYNSSVELPMFQNHFEVIDLSFIQQQDVVDFTKAVDESRGIFLYRWGDAPLRYITLALFANGTELLHRQTLGLVYCHPC